MILLIVLCTAILAALGSGVFFYLRFKANHDAKARLLKMKGMNPGNG